MSPHKWCVATRANKFTGERSKALSRHKTALAARGRLGEVGGLYHGRALVVRRLTKEERA